MPLGIATRPGIPVVGRQGVPPFLPFIILSVGMRGAERHCGVLDSTLECPDISECSGLSPGATPGPSPSLPPSLSLGLSHALLPPCVSAEAGTKWPPIC